MVFAGIVAIEKPPPCRRTYLQTHTPNTAGQSWRERTSIVTGFETPLPSNKLHPRR